MSSTSIGEVIRNRRETLGLSQARFGRRLGPEGVDAATIANWESRGVKPDYQSLCFLVQYGGIQPTELLGEPLAAMELAG